MRKYRQSGESEFNGLPVNASETMKVHGEIIETLHDNVGDYTTRHNKAYVLMMTLNYPQDRSYPQDNELFARRFLHNFTVDRKRRKLDPAYVWCTERKEGSPNVHHHLVLMLNGNVTRHPHQHVEVARRHWKAALGTDSADGLVNYGSGRNGEYGHMIYRNDHESRARAFEHMSYLGKVNSKEGVPAGVRRFGSSRVGSR